MTHGWLWRLVERRLQRVLPRSHGMSTLGDLAEDYARRRERGGVFSARWWLLREARSLEQSYKQITRSPDHPIAHSRNRMMLFDDLRLGARRLRSRPAIAVVCAGLLALGIGLSTAMFSVADSLVVRPVPFAHADRLVQVTVGRGATRKPVVRVR